MFFEVITSCEINDCAEPSTCSPPMGIFSIGGADTYITKCDL